MKKDIEFPAVEQVFVAIAKEGDDKWTVYLINRNKSELTNVMVTSKGYGEADGEQKKTSILRHAIPILEPNEFALIEPIHPDVFKLYNEYWVSYFIGEQLYDKKYIFVPDSIKEEHLSYVPELEKSGVLHE